MNRGNGISISQCILGVREGRDLLMVEFSLVKAHKCLGCHMVMEKVTCMDVNLSNIAIVYSAVVVVMIRIVHKIGETIHQEEAKPE